MCKIWLHCNLHMYIGSYILISQTVPCSVCSVVFKLQHLVHWVPFVFRLVPPLPLPRLNINKWFIQDISYVPRFLHKLLQSIPDSKVHGAHLGPTWVLSVPGGPPVGPMNLAIRDPCHTHYDEQSDTLSSQLSELLKHVFLFQYPVHIWQMSS